MYLESCGVHGVYSNGRVEGKVVKRMVEEKIETGLGKAWGDIVLVERMSGGDC